MSVETITQLGDFGWALSELREGRRVARAGWNGKGMWLKLVSSGEWALTHVATVPLLPFIGMKTTGGEFVPWLASQTDMLATDWTLVP